MLGLGFSVATPPGGIRGEVLVVNSFDELEERADDAQGRIVLFNVPFTTYGQTVQYRSRGAVAAAQAGAVASLIRSVTPYSQQTPHTGNSSYEDGVPRIPHAAITVEDADLVMIGSDRPLDPGLESARVLYERWPRVRAELDRVDLGRPLQLVARYQMDREGALAVAGDIERNTDDNMRVEYSAPRNLHADTQGANFEVMVPFLDVPSESFGDDPQRMALLAREYRLLDDWVRAISAMSTAAQLAEEPLLRAAYLAEAESWQNDLRRYLDGEDLEPYELPSPDWVYGGAVDGEEW